MKGLILSNKLSLFVTCLSRINCARSLQERIVEQTGKTSGSTRREWISMYFVTIGSHCPPVSIGLITRYYVWELVSVHGVCTVLIWIKMINSSQQLGEIEKRGWNSTVFHQDSYHQTIPHIKSFVFVWLHVVRFTSTPLCTGFPSYCGLLFPVHCIHCGFLWRLQCNFWSLRTIFPLTAWGNKACFPDSWVCLNSGYLFFTSGSAITFGVIFSRGL